jgi:uncharacterized protein YgiM (DUF1202 family)
MPPSPTPLPRVIVNVDALKVRSGPGQTFTQLATVKRGEVYRILGKNATGDWWQICCVAGGQEGWVRADMVIAEGAVETVPVVGGE